MPRSGHGPAPDLRDRIVFLLHPVFDDADQRADVVELCFLQDPWRRQSSPRSPLRPPGPVLPLLPLPPDPPPAAVTRG